MSKDPYFVTIDYHIDNEAKHIAIIDGLDGTTVFVGALNDRNIELADEIVKRFNSK